MSATNYIGRVVITLLVSLWAISSYAQQDQLEKAPSEHNQLGNQKNTNDMKDESENRQTGQDKSSCNCPVDRRW